MVLFFLVVVTVAGIAGADTNIAVTDTLTPAQTLVTNVKTDTSKNATTTRTIQDSTKAANRTLFKSIADSRPDVEWSLSAAKIVWTVLFFLVAYIAIRYATRFLELIAERRTESRLTIKAVLPVIRIIGWTIVLYLIIARILAPPIETLLALTASTGIAIGFASQDILKNIFGGIVILFDRPFQVGDKIEIGKYYGEVVNIGLRTIRIVTPDDSLVSVPNSEVVNQSVSNSNTGESNCQVVAEFYLPPDIDTARVKAIAIKAAKVSPYIFLNKPVYVVFKNEVHDGRSMLKMRLKAYVLDIRQEFAFMSDMTQRVLDKLLQDKIVDRSDLLHVYNAGKK